MSDNAPALLRNTESTARLRALVERLDEADLQRSLGGGFPAEDRAVNDTLVSLPSVIRPDTVGPEAVRAAELVDATLAGLSAARRDSLVAEGLGFAVERWQHRHDHIAQIEAVLS